MTNKPRRYVRVRRVRQWSHHSHFGRYYAPWSVVDCDFCHSCHSDTDHAAAIQVAHNHAAECPAVAAATQRDQFAQEVHQLRQELTDRRLITDDLRAELATTAAERDHAYRLLSDIAWVLGGPDDIPEAVSLLRQAYRDERADNSRLRAERDQWRTKAHELAAELLLRDERKETQ